jgi:hypothetical protein
LCGASSFFCFNTIASHILVSGVKLYKGETLLELTERWRFIYKRLYDPDEDLFDLSRIPDVHDNVRFDVLHNPHLGLSSTLEKLYSLAKSMADTVVPQEYGTTFAQKRSVGIKICSPLLDKILHDLCIARTDNKTDMRYMINMDYSADLPINTMGRRIRTRLYFTSESHLHTMLNVLRFAAMGPTSTCCSSPVLSTAGMKFLNNTKEVCYLTQIVIRLFEDTSQPLDNHRRFRVEILFSAGASATPLHMAESSRDNDTTRLDTDALRSVGREGLTCKEVEDFFDSIISEGGSKEKENLDVCHKADAANKFTEGDPVKLGISSDSDAVFSDSNSRTVGGDDKRNAVKDVTVRSEIAQDGDNKKCFPPIPKRITLETPAVTEQQQKRSTKFLSGVSKETIHESNGTEEKKTKEKRLKDKSIGVKENKNKSDDSSPNQMSHKTFYMTVATGTLLLGAGCLVMAISLSGGRNHSRRRYTTR